METARFTVRPADGEWRTDPRDPSLERAIGHVFGQLLRLEAIPPEVPVVGHVQLYGRWCVFVRPHRSSRLGAMLLDTERYASLGYDPFLVGARAFGVPDLQRLVDGDPLPPAPTAPSRPIPVESCGDYLPLAYARFLTSEPSERAELYVSVLAPGVPTERVPLASFTAAPTAEASPPARPPQPAPSPPPAAPAAGGPPGKPPAEGLEDLPGEWFDLPLARTEEPQAEPRPAPEAEPEDRDEPFPTPAEEPAEPAPAIARSLRRRTVALAAAAALLAVACGFALWRISVLDRRIEALDASSARLATLAQGLGIPSDEADPEAAVRARLYDVATVSVQSGAWNEGLRQRGVEPAEFLDRLVELSGVQPSLSRLAAAEQPLLAVAERSGALVAVAGVDQSLLALAAEAEALSRAAAVEARLTALAAAQPALDRLAGAEGPLSSLATREEDLVQLLGQASTLTSAAREVANLVVFMERHQRDLERLAQRTASLVEISGEQRHLVDLARKKATLDALIASSERLLALVDSPGLAQLAADPEAVSALAADLDRLLQLARHSQVLLEVVAERSQQER